jgi:hypothetical protein
VGRVVAIWQGGSGPPQRNDRFLPAVAFIHEHGLFDRPFLTPRCRSMDHAEDVRRSLYLACRYFCSCGERLCTRKNPNTKGCPDGGQRVSVRADIVKDAKGKLRVQCTFYDKTEAMRQVVATYGPDPSNWPYQARAKKMRQSRA